MGRSTALMFAGGTMAGGGSGFKNMVHMSRAGVFDAHIVGVVSHHPAEGGVGQLAKRLHIPFHHFPHPWDEEGHQRLAAKTKAEWFLLSGWPKYVAGLDPARTFNIHPGDIPRFGGGNMYGMRVHRATMEAYARGEVQHSAVCMHFISAHNPSRPPTEQYDTGPVFLRQEVPILPDDTPESLAERVKAFEHRLQPEISNLVVHHEISWDGKDPESLRIPSWYRIERRAEEVALA